MDDTSSDSTTQPGDTAQTPLALNEPEGAPVAQPQAAANPAPEQPTAAPPTAPEPDPIKERVHQTVTEWLHQRIHNGPLAEITAGYNHLVAELEELKARIVNLIKEKE